MIRRLRAAWRIIRRGTPERPDYWDDEGTYRHADYGTSLLLPEDGTEDAVKSVLRYNYANTKAHLLLRNGVLLNPGRIIRLTDALGDRDALGWRAEGVHVGRQVALGEVTRLYEQEQEITG